MSGFGAKPRAYMCYLCGQQYGSQSLYIHVANCQKKWEAAEQQKLQRERRPLPPVPRELADGELPKTALEIDDFNARMFHYFNELSLVKCGGYQRTFRPDALEHHIKSCPPRQGRQGGQGSVVAKIGAKPRAYTCYLCGQQFGSQSLKLHIPRCQQKWEAVEETKPKRERRPQPPQPPKLDEPLPTKPQLVDEFNNKMYEYWSQVSLVQCHICSRTFLPEAMEKHRKVCTPETPGGPLGLKKNAPHQQQRISGS